MKIKDMINNKKAFTLIELLAVIVILAVITLITVPMINAVIKTTRISSFKSSADGLVSSSKIYFSNQIKKGEFNGITFKFGENSNLEGFDIKGKQPTGGEITITSDGKVKMAITDGEFCAFKEFNSNEVYISEGENCAINPISPTIKVVTNKITSNTVAVVASCNHDNGIEKYEFSKDNGETWVSKIVNGNYSNFYIFNDLSNSNTYNLTVKCISGSGTIAQINKNVSLKEITSPVINIPDGWSKEKIITIIYPNGRYKNEYSLDGGTTWKEYIGEFTIQKNLTIYVRSIDSAGNKTTSSAQITQIDRTPPSCNNEGDSTTWTNVDRTIKWGCTDEAGGSGCNSLVSGGSKKFTSTTKKSVIPTYTIKDNAGNETACPKRTANVYVDTTRPTCGGYSGSSKTWTSGDRTIHVGCSDANSGCTSGTFQQTFTTNYKQANTNIVISDNAGNTRICSEQQNIYVAKYASIEYDTILDNQDIKYSGNGNIGGTVGQSRGINNIQIRAEATNISGGISYQVHMQTLDNRSPISDGWFLLNDQKITDKRIEKINAHLTGDMANAFDLYYRVHVRNQGWLNVVKGNETDWTGSSGLCKRIEAIQMKIVPKNSGVPTFSSEGSTISTNATILNTSNATNNCQTSSPSTATGDVCSSKTCTYVYYTAKSRYFGSNCDPVCSQMGGTLVSSSKCNPSSSCCCKTTTYTRHTGKKACCS